MILCVWGCAEWCDIAKRNGAGQGLATSAPFLHSSESSAKAPSSCFN